MEDQRLVVVIPTDNIYVETNEENDVDVIFEQLEVVLVRGTEPSYFTNKECCHVQVAVGMLLLNLDITDLRRRGTKVLIGRG